LMLVLAHVGMHAEASSLAAKLEEKVKPDAEFLIDLGRTYAQCAAVASLDFQSRYTCKAMCVLRAAVELGYRDEMYLKTEVDLDPLRTDPDFARLVDEVSRRPG